MPSKGGNSSARALEQKFNLVGNRTTRSQKKSSWSVSRRTLEYVCMHTHTSIYLHRGCEGPNLRNPFLWWIWGVTRNFPTRLELCVSSCTVLMPSIPNSVHSWSSFPLVVKFPNCLPLSIYIYSIYMCICWNIRSSFLTAYLSLYIYVYMLRYP